MILEKPYLKVLYNGINITADISRNLLSFTYTDRMEEADTLDIEVEDSNQKWQKEWYPEKGATINAEIGKEGDVILDCGNFEIDEIELLGSPDSINIRAIAAGFKKGQKRSGKSHVHENKTLAEIVKTVAEASGLRVQGQIEDVRIGRLVQRKERDVRFLHRLARDYGYTFNVRDDQAIFIKREDLEDARAVAVLEKKDLLNFSIKDKSTNTYKHVSIKYHNPETDKTIEHIETDPDNVDTDDTLELKKIAETEAQARIMTKAALREANLLQQSGSISLPGSPLLVSGNVIELRGLGRLSGDYIIKSAAHTISNQDGWIADLDIYKVNYKEEQTGMGGQTVDVDPFDFEGDIPYTPEEIANMAPEDVRKNIFGF